MSAGVLRVLDRYVSERASELIALQDLIDAQVGNYESELSDVTLLYEQATAARNAVAELIFADKEFDDAKDEQDESASYDQEGAYVSREVYDRMEAAIARRRAALARVEGAK